MERTNSSDTSIELTMNELDSVAGGVMDAKTFAAACLCSPAFLAGAIVGIAIVNVREAMEK